MHTALSGSQPRRPSGENGGVSCIPAYQYHFTSSVQWPRKAEGLTGWVVLYFTYMRQPAQTSAMGGTTVLNRGGPCRPAVCAVKAVHDKDLQSGVGRGRAQGGTGSTSKWPVVAASLGQRQRQRTMAGPRVPAPRGPTRRYEVTPSIFRLRGETIRCT